MNLYVVRHADARPLGGAVTTDAERPLSARGEDDARMMGRVLARIEPQAPLVVCSPLLRARRTAELLAGAYAATARPEVWEDLEPGVRLKGIVSRLQQVDAAAVVLIGHQPDMGHLLAFLIADVACEIVLPPAAMASIAFQPSAGAGSARLHWLLTPDLVSSLADPNS